jgi:hypothetical protein
MEAAERIFDGAFDDLTDDAAGASMSSADPIKQPERCRVTTRLVVCPLFTCVVRRFLYDYRLQRRRTMVLKMRSEVMTRAKVGRSVDSVSRAHSFFPLQQMMDS